MIEIKLTCSQCGKPPNFGDALYYGEGALEYPFHEWLQKQLNGTTWVVQLNGGHTDTYCCAECAK